jgi:hypothetical protein
MNGTVASVVTPSVLSADPRCPHLIFHDVFGSAWVVALLNYVAERQGDFQPGTMRNRKTAKRRFSGSRGAAEHNRSVVYTHRARMQHDLFALMHQDAEGGAEDEDRNIAGIGAGLGFKCDLVAGGEQETRHTGNAQQKLLAGDLPGRTRCGRIC